MSAKVPELTPRMRESDQQVERTLHIIHGNNKNDAIRATNQILKNRVIVEENIDYLVEYMKCSDDYDLERQIGRICLQSSILSQDPDGMVVQGLSYLVEDNTKDIRTGKVSKYENETYTINYSSVEDILDALKNIIGNDNIEYLESEGHRYRLVNSNTDRIVGEFSIDIEHRHYIDSVDYSQDGNDQVTVCIHSNKANQAFSREQRKLILIGLKGLIKCVKKGSKLDKSVISTVELLAQNGVRTKIRDYSIALLRQYVEQFPTYFYENEETMIQIFVYNDYDDMKSLKHLSHIVRSIDSERIENDSLISNYFRDNMDRLVGGDKKMCRRSISRLVGKSSLKIYIDEILENNNII